MKRALHNLVILASLSVLMTIALIAILLGAVGSAYFVPDSADLVDVLWIWLLAVSTLTSLVLQPARRERHGRPRRGVAWQCTARQGRGTKTTAPQPQGRGAVIPPRSIA